MKLKVLFVASKPAHIKSFHLPYLKWFQEQGYETHIATNGRMDLPYINKQWIVDFKREPLRLDNLKAYRQLKHIIDRERYVLINCHTPVASVLTRIASRRARKKGTKVLYTAHGFHFYKGGPYFFWGTFYPLEVYLTRTADAVITLNNEDYQRIKSVGSPKADYFKISGVGVDKRNFRPINNVEKCRLRRQKGFPENKTIIIYAAEFIDRKNHTFIIDTVKRYPNLFDNTLILFAGRGKREKTLQEKVRKENLEESIQFIGYRSDIDEMFKLSDIGVSVSKQEGLPINVVEEMMCGLPMIVSNIRGHNDLIENEVNGFLFSFENARTFAEMVKRVATDKELSRRISTNAIQKAQEFELQNVLKELTSIFLKYLTKK